jgi:hypothetical protein
VVAVGAAAGVTGAATGPDHPGSSRDPAEYQPTSDNACGSTTGSIFEGERSCRPVHPGQRCSQAGNPHTDRIDPSQSYICALGPEAEAETGADAGGLGRSIPLGFSGVSSYESFVDGLYAGLRNAGVDDAVAIFQGSSTTGRSFRTGELFDVGRTSDYDIALVSLSLLGRADEAGVGLRSSGQRTRAPRRLRSALICCPR